MATAKTPTSPDMISEVLTHSLGLAFDSVKEKLTTNMQENGEQYLQQAVEKIKESTAGIVDWAKENPMKTALAVAALAAVSTFLVRTMASSVGSDSTASGGDDSEKSATSTSKAKKKSATARGK